MATSIGVSAGNGMVHCALVTSADGRSQTDTRVIDVDHTDGFDRAGRINAGIDLMLAQAKESGHRVSEIGVAVRSNSDGRPVALRGYGPRRQVQIFSESEAIAKVLIDSGEVDRFTSVIVADAGDSGVTTFALDPATGTVTDSRRSTDASGVALDKAFTQAVQESDPRLSDLAGPERDALADACRTIKEDLAAGKDATISTGLERSSVTVSPETFDKAAREVTAQVAAAVKDAVSARDSKPEAIVLVGGLANMPQLKTAVQEEFSGDVLVPEVPETVAARGAAVLAQGVTSASRLAFIGGARTRSWFSLSPIALVGAVLLAALMTAYAVGSTSAESESESTVASATTTTSGSPAQSSSASLTSQPAAPAAEQSQAAPVPQYPATDTYTQPETRPSWATTELPATTTQSPSESGTSTPPSWPSAWPSWPLPSWPFSPPPPPTNTTSKAPASPSSKPSATNERQQKAPSSTPVPSTPAVR